MCCLTFHRFSMHLTQIEHRPTATNWYGTFNESVVCLYIRNPRAHSCTCQHKVLVEMKTVVREQ